MTFDEYIASLKDEVEAYAKWYKQCNAASPEMFPLTTNDVNTWFEGFIDFDSGEENDDE